MRLKSIAVVGMFAACLSCLAQSRPHVYDLKNVKWSVVLNPDQESMTGDVANTIQADTQLSEATLDCGPALELDRVTVEGKPAVYRRHADKLTIKLPHSIDAGQTVTLRIVYHGNPEAGLYFVPAKRAFPSDKPLAYTQGEMEDTRQWLPTYDYPDNKATSEGTIEVPKDWVAISNGQLIDVVQKDSSVVYHWKMAEPHSTYLISLTAGPYVEAKEAWDGIPVSYWVPIGLEDQGKASFAGTNQIVGFYSGLTGYRYPYVKFTQDVVADFMFGGMENITAVTQTIDTLHPPSAEPVEHSSGLVAHELAHQWFGDLVTCKDWSNIWLNEGFATFLPWFWDRKDSGQEAFDLDRYEGMRTALGAQRDAHRPVVWTGYHDPLEMFDGMAYQGGASRMFMLMDTLGEDTFWKGINDYLKAKQYQNVTTEDFFAEMSRSSHRDLKPFMQQWFFTPGVPQLTVSAANGQVVVKQTEPYFDLDVPVWINRQGSWDKKSLHVSGAQSTMDLATEDANNLLVDPECRLMVIIDDRISRSPEAKMALYQAAPNAAEKARLFDAWNGSWSAEQRITLVSLEPSVALRERWIPTLGTPGQAFLITCASDRDARIRNAAARALGNTAATPECEATLKQLALGSGADPNDTVRESAYRSLLWLTGDAAMADQAFRMDGFQDRYRRIAMEWWVDHRPDAARERALDVLNGSYSEPLRIDCIEDLGRLKDRQDERRVYSALLKIEQEHSCNARCAAIRSLGQYGDRKAIPVLKLLSDHPLIFIRAAVGDALRQLGG